MKMRTVFCLSAYIVIISVIFFSCRNEPGKIIFRSSTEVKARGNSWVTSVSDEKTRVVSDSGITCWEDTGTVINTWFRLERTGILNLALIGKTLKGKSVIRWEFGGYSGEKKLTNRDHDTIFLSTFNISKPGYQSLILKGIKRSGPEFAEIKGILISGSATEGRTNFVRDDFYWGRRGPSVHLRYDIPPEANNIEWFYNEITVPSGNDITGSYFMADGFSDGYFGMQVNGPEERRILFSVWSPYKTNNPKEIPEAYRIKLIQKGKDVHTGEFGNEGSGGQSYLKFFWKAENTYRFLLRAKPTMNNSTDYTAYFYPPENGNWQVIASFRCPERNTYLKNLYSFLENFLTETGCQTREGLFSNQWICTSEGKWIELKVARFTADATARKGSRLDYAGGVRSNSFYLKNCGFFNELTVINSELIREKSAGHPAIDLEEIKKIASPKLNGKAIPD